MEGKVDGFAAFLRETLVERNSLIDFDSLLIVKRSGSMGLPSNWQGNTEVERGKYNNEIAELSLRSGQTQTVYKPEESMFVGDVDLHFDGEKMMFSTKGEICEVGLDGKGFRKVIDAMDSYDPCYLPDNRILFCSASGQTAVPCVGGKSYVGNLHIANADGTGIRRLCFDQDNNWYPVMMENGRVMYTRWEYTDSAHYFSRVLMSMNPDGTNQMAFYGSNSYWPNSLFYARPIPGSSTKFVGIISGHHGVKRMGELILFDAAKGRHEAEGVIQRIPGRGETVEPVIKDRLVDSSWPRFLHPYPLNDSFFLAACQPSPTSLWGIYLVDVFDNVILLKEEPGTHLLEPLPLRKTKRPPVIADRVDPEATEAFVLITDIYKGTGLEGVPRGKVKQLRILQYEYAYRHTGGHYVVGFEGPWDVRRLLGTVPVYEDGSAQFRVPANVPLAVQPLDEEGKALAQMRSWFTAMPGEFLSCVGCHEKQNSAPPSAKVMAVLKPVVEVTPWYGPKRGFSFRREVQPVLDKNCVGCHDGKKEGRPNFVDGGLMNASGQSQYSQAYLSLHPFVRRNGPEGDYRPLTPLEFHANTSELVQMLEKGHHNVKLNDEDWDRLITWIDLNVPFHGTWSEAAPKLEGEYITARRKNMAAYAGVTENIEEVLNPYREKAAFVKPKPAKRAPRISVSAPKWPLSADAARTLQGERRELVLDLGKGLAMKFVRIPAGEFVMGSDKGAQDETPRSQVRIDKAFWLGTFEVTNEQYNLFDPSHDSGVYDKHYKDQVDRGYYVNQPDKPVIRVSWQQAMDFCRWLTEKTGRRATLPDEAQWEWACRAGADTPLWWGETDSVFEQYANLADVTMKQLAVRGVNPQPVNNPDQYWAYVPARYDSNDGVLHLASPGKYAANPWGLYDIHGNVAEWTLSAFRPYPYAGNDGRNGLGDEERRVVRGGSWRDRPHRASSSYRLSFPDWQRVYNVGFRVALEESTVKIAHGNAD